MKSIPAWQTSDGTVFTDQERAIAYADKRYGDALTRLAHEAVRMEKYAAMTEFIEANLYRFLMLSELRKDRKLEPEDDA